MQKTIPMKKLYLVLLSFCFTVLLSAQIPKTSAITPGGLTSKTDTTTRTAPNLTNKGKSDTPDLKTLPQNTEILRDLERAVHGNPQMLDGYLKRPSISQELMSLTGNDRIKARQLVMELEQNLRMAAAPNPNTPTHTLSPADTKGRNVVQLEKVRQLNRLMDTNNQVSVKNENAIPDANRPGMDYSRSEQNFELNRMESEKQTITEMEKYRNEILNRLIKEEYYRLINDKTPEAPETNLGSTPKLAKYKALREILHGQMSRKSKPGIPNKGTTNLPVQKQVEPDNLMQQLDSKIQEEEQRAEMFARHRMEMERRMGQENQNQNQNK